MNCSPSYCNLFPGFEISHAKGHKLISIDGEEYLDLFANFGVTNLGHDTRVAQAAKDQIDKCMMIMTSDLINRPAYQLAEKLVEITKFPPHSKVCFGNSGAEANEIAIKLAHWNIKGIGLSFINAFHGRTLGILKHSASKKIHSQGFQIERPIYIPHFGDLFAIDYIEDVIFKKLCDPSEISYLITEPIQIEGGVVVPEKDFHKKLAKLCKENGILLIFDEVQTGFKRTGKFFAFQEFGIRPDIITLGKAIANGFPLSATISPLMTWGIGAQGSTFGGSVVSCAASLKTIEILEKEVDISAIERIIGNYLRQDTPPIVGISGMGAIWSMTFPNQEIAEEVRLEIFKKKILTIPCGESSIRIEPPLTIDPEELIMAMETICKITKEVVGNHVIKYL